MDKRKDYPAAHSADTQWYAVDECGHVISCYSNESGAIPTQAITSIESARERDEEMRWEQEERLGIQTLSPAHAHFIAEQFKGKHRDQKFSFGGMVYILSNLPPEINAEMKKFSKDPGRAPLVRTIEPSKATGNNKYVILGIYWNNDAVFNAKIHALDLCVTCTAAFNLKASRVGRGDMIPFYDHPSANGDAYPYFLQYVPETLKKVDELRISDEAKKELKDGAVMPGCFLNQPFWQPCEDLECEFYGQEDQGKSVDDKLIEDLKHGPFGYW